MRVTQAKNPTLKVFDPLAQMKNVSQSLSEKNKYMQHLHPVDCPMDQQPFIDVLWRL